MSTEKVSTLIIEVDLQCEKCYRKIQKLLCKLQTKENIRKIDYEKKKNRVTISGPFNPDMLYKKLKCKACYTIKDIKIVKLEEKKPEEKTEVNKKQEEDRLKVKKQEGEKPEDKAKKKAKAKAAAPVPWSSTTNVNLQFNNICVICYRWPCKCSKTTQPHEPKPIPAAKEVPEKPVVEMVKPLAAAPAPPQWSSTANVNVQYNNMCVICYPRPCRCSETQWGSGKTKDQCQWPPQPCCKWPGCGGPWYCGCGGQPCMPPPIWCPGPSLCRGCNGCRIVQECKFTYEEYPHDPCAIM